MHTQGEMKVANQGKSGNKKPSKGKQRDKATTDNKNQKTFLGTQRKESHTQSASGIKRATRNRQQEQTSQQEEATRNRIRGAKR